MKIAKWALLSLVVLVMLAVAALAVLSWKAESRLGAELAAIRAAGDPVTLADLAGRALSPNENAVTYLERAGTAIEAIHVQVAELITQEDLDELALGKIEAAWDAHPDVLPLLEQAARASGYQPQLDYTLPPEQFMARYLERINSLPRAVARVLSARVRLLLAKGQREEAFETAMLLWHLCRQFEHEPMLVAQLVSLACKGIAADATNRVLRDGPISPESRQALEALLATQQEMSGYAWALKSERAYANETFRTMFGGWPRPWPFKHDQADFLQRIAKELEIGPLPAYKAAPLRAQFTPADNELGPLTRHTLTSYDALREGQDRVRAEIASLRVLNALQARGEELEAAGALDQLSLPEEAKTDPFTGRPLHVEKLAEGWLIYSVGKNLHDDGGKIDDRSDIGFGPK